MIQVAAVVPLAVFFLISNAPARDNAVQVFTPKKGIAAARFG